jgi:hypothetical protein
MVMAKIDRPIFKPIPKPIPKPPVGTDCFPDKPGPIQINPDALDKLKDAKSFHLQDEDKSGTLSREEFDAGRHPLEKLVDPKKFDRYDGNGDGAIDREEYHAGREKERFKEAIRGKLDLPKWEGKKLEDGVKAGAEKVVDTVKDALDDIF